MAEKPVVMISSTARDLPEYREQVRDACLSAECASRDDGTPCLLRIPILLRLLLGW